MPHNMTLQELLEAVKKAREGKISDHVRNLVKKIAEHELKKAK